MSTTTDTHELQVSTSMPPPDALRTLAHVLEGHSYRDLCDTLSFDEHGRRAALKLCASLDKARSEHRSHSLRVVLACNNEPAFFVRATFRPLHGDEHVLMTPPLQSQKRPRDAQDASGGADSGSSSDALSSGHSATEARAVSAELGDGRPPSSL